MGQVLITETYLTDIANAIRKKNGSTTTYKPSEMAAAILAITTSSDTPSVTYNDTGVDCSAMKKLGSFTNKSTTTGDLSGHTAGKLTKCIPNNKKIHFKAVVFVPTGLQLNDMSVSDFTNGRSWSPNNNYTTRKSYPISTGINYVFDWDENIAVTSYDDEDDKTNNLLTYYCCSETHVKQATGSTTSLDTATLTVSAYEP